jgi:large subunit ribosomal protein L10
MNREQKAACVADLRERFSKAKLALLAEYRGLTAGQLDELRRSVRAAQGEYRVAKNTLARRAVADTGAREIGPLLSGPTALVFSSGDPVIVAKVVVRFADGHEALSVKGGVLEGEYLTAEAVKILAELPNREELLGRLLAVLQGPAVQLLRTLREPATRLARLVNAIARKQEGAQSGGA